MCPYLAGLPPCGLRPHPPAPGLTRSRGTIKNWSQDCLATGPQPVWPTTRLSTFSTASTSPAGRTGSSGQARSRGHPLPPAPCGPLLTGQVSSTTLRLGPAPQPALGGAPGQCGRRGPSRHGGQQLLTAQEADLQRPCGDSAGNTVKCHLPPPHPGLLKTAEPGPCPP